jgi:hypothetical protein
MTVRFQLTCLLLTLCLAVNGSANSETLLLTCKGKYSGLVYSHGGVSNIEESEDIVDLNIVNKTLNGVSATHYTQEHIKFESTQFLDLAGQSTPMWRVSINRETGRIEQSRIEVDKFGENLMVAMLIFRGVCSRVTKNKF